MPPRKSAYYDEDDFDDEYSDEDEYWDEDDGEYEDDAAPGRQQVSRLTFLTASLSPFLLMTPTSFPLVLHISSKSSPRV